MKLIFMFKYDVKLFNYKLLKIDLFILSLCKYFLCKFFGFLCRVVYFVWISLNLYLFR